MKKINPDYIQCKDKPWLYIIPPISYQEAVRKEKEEMANKIGFKMTLDDETMKMNEEKEKQKKFKEWQKKHPDYSDVKIPKKAVKVKNAKPYGEVGIDDSKLFSENNLTESQKKITEICDSMKDLLLYKNQKYGDSALNPNNIFYKGDSTNSIKIRLDDKIGRIKNCEETRINDVCDIIGYSVLLLVSMEVSKNEIKLLKD